MALNVEMLYIFIRVRKLYVYKESQNSMKYLKIEFKTKKVPSEMNLNENVSHDEKFFQANKTNSVKLR